MQLLAEKLERAKAALRDAERLWNEQGHRLLDLREVQVKRDAVKELRRSMEARAEELRTKARRLRKDLRAGALFDETVAEVGRTKRPEQPPVRYTGPWEPQNADPYVVDRKVEKESLGSFGKKDETK